MYDFSHKLLFWILCVKYHIYILLGHVTNLDGEMVTRWRLSIFITCISSLWQPWLMTNWHGCLIIITMIKKWLLVIWYEHKQTYQPTCLPTYLPMHPSTYQPIYFPTHQPTYLPTHPPTYLPKPYLLTHPHTHIHTYLPITYMPTHAHMTQLPTYLPIYLTTHSSTYLLLISYLLQPTSYNLLIYLPPTTCLFTYLLLISNLLQATYLLLTILKFTYYLLYNLVWYEINVWNKKLDKNLALFDGVVHW